MDVAVGLLPAGASQGCMECSPSLSFRRQCEQYTWVSAQGGFRLALKRNYGHIGNDTLTLCLAAVAQCQNA